MGNEVLMDQFIAIDAEYDQNPGVTPTLGIFKLFWGNKEMLLKK